jgi:uncharacterized protein (DUF4415 family)
MNVSTKTNAVHTMDAEMLQFAQDVRTSLRQAANGEYARVTTPEQMQARKVGRPLGSTKANPKQVVKIRLDPDVLAGLRATGRGWQTNVNETMKIWLNTRSAA